MGIIDKKELPKLPKGMGNYDYVRDKIRYRKQITFNNVKKNLSVTGTSVAEVNKLMQKKEAEFKKNVKLGEIRKETITLSLAMREWMDLYKSEELNRKSFDRLESTYLNHICNTKLGNTSERIITSDMIQLHLKTLTNKKTGEKLSYSSTKKVYELLCQYFRYRYSNNPFVNPMMRVPRPKDKTEKLSEELIVWDDDEMIKLTQIAFEPYITGKSGYKHGLVIAFIMWSFIRVGEASALQWKDIDLEKGILNITKQLSRVKNRSVNNSYESIITTTKYNSARKIPLNNMALDCIKEYKYRKGDVKDTDYVLDKGDGKVVAENTLLNTYKLMCEKAGLPEEKHVTIHGLRHSGISYMLRHGMSVEVVSKFAGHKSIQVTQNTYYSVIESQKQDEMTKFNQNNSISFK